MPLATHSDGVRVRVRLTPGASANAIRGVQREADGTVSLRVAVTAPPEDGKANAALIRTLADTWKLRISDMTIVAGSKDRRKTIAIRGDSGRLSTHIRSHLAALSRSGEA